MFDLLYFDISMFRGLIEESEQPERDLVSATEFEFRNRRRTNRIAHRRFVVNIEVIVIIDDEHRRTLGSIDLV